jgi:DNA-binding transcriptional LysR family regulator
MLPAIRQLEYFVAVAEEGQFTRAAERLHIAQPSVSAQVRQLERTLGTPLFHRGFGPVTLTPTPVKPSCPSHDASWPI